MYLYMKLWTNGLVLILYMMLSETCTWNHEQTCLLLTFHHMYVDIHEVMHDSPIKYLPVEPLKWSMLYHFPKEVLYCERTLGLLVIHMIQKGFSSYVASCHYMYMCTNILYITYTNTYKCIYMYMCTKIICTNIIII